MGGRRACHLVLWEAVGARSFQISVHSEPPGAQVKSGRGRAGARCCSGSATQESDDATSVALLIDAGARAARTDSHIQDCRLSSAEAGRPAFAAATNIRSDGHKTKIGDPAIDQRCTRSKQRRRRKVVGRKRSGQAVAPQVQTRNAFSFFCGGKTDPKEGRSVCVQVPCFALPQPRSIDAR
jgi:hypothetical protein